eukprot:6458603-Amphidinium_carterae.1
MCDRSHACIAVNGYGRPKVNIKKRDAHLRTPSENNEGSLVSSAIQERCSVYQMGRARYCKLGGSQPQSVAALMFVDTLGW